MRRRAEESLGEFQKRRADRDEIARLRGALSAVRDATAYAGPASPSKAGDIYRLVDEVLKEYDYA